MILPIFPPVFNLTFKFVQNVFDRDLHFFVSLIDHFFPLWFLPLSYAQDVCFHAKIIYTIINVLVQFFIHISFTDLY